jgi:Undecaprenyl-phosphate glucose phosphotransferase
MAYDALQHVNSFRVENSLKQFRAEHARAGLSLLGAAIDATAIVAAVLISGTVYHFGVLGVSPPYELLIQVAVLLSLFILMPSFARQDYAISSMLEFKSQPRKMLVLWNMAFAAAIIVSFFTKTSTELSRGTMILAYGAGMFAVLLSRYVTHRIVMTVAKTRSTAARRIFLVGHENEIVDFAVYHQPWNLGMQIVGTHVIPDTDGTAAVSQSAAMADAVLAARDAAPDDVFILLSWRNRDLIDMATETFMAIPSSIHIGVDPSLQRFHDIRMSRLGSISSLQIVRRPLSLGSIVLKRGFDLIGALLGLILLSPLFAILAIAIKLDSKGPVLFIQRRYGFNQQSFRIVKFRSMYTMDDGIDVRQATKNDPRITRVGRILRRFNLDELPQLLNVLQGTMSLVGPRPHALAHDTDYGRRIALYARRHNVKPGITGWAQVNGLRGETTSDDVMKARVEHDLFYIDNWSLLMDVTIIIRTVISPKAYRNAL